MVRSKGVEQIKCTITGQTHRMFGQRKSEVTRECKLAQYLCDLGPKILLGLVRVGVTVRATEMYQNMCTKPAAD